MAITVTVSYGGTKQAAANNTQFTALPGGTLTLIECATGAFITNDVQPGDGAIVAGSTSNNGTHMVECVLSNTLIVVQFAGTTEAGMGTCRIDAASHTLNVTNETTVTWASVATAVNNRALIREERLSANSAGAGITASTGYQYKVYAHAFNSVGITNNTSVTTTWTSIRELVYRRGGRASAVGTSNGGFGFTFSLAGANDLVVMIIGQQTDAADRHTFGNGSVWLGFGWSPGGTESKVTLRAFGSFLSNQASSSTNGITPGATVNAPGKMYGMILDGQWQVSAATGTTLGVELQDVLHVSSGPALVVLDSVDFLGNYIVAQSAGVASYIFAPAAVITGLLLSDDAFTPVTTLVGQDIDFRNLLEDVDPTLLGTFAFSSTLRKSYTWRPRIVTSNILAGGGAGCVTPLSGVRVEAYEIEIERLVRVVGTDNGTYNIIINGVSHQYVASGASATTIANNLRDVINAGAQPVTATTVTDTLVPTVRIAPDVPTVGFSLAITSPSSDLALRPHIITVSGSPFTTDANGKIGDVKLETYFKTTNTANGDMGGVNKQALVIANHAHYGINHHQFAITRELEEDIDMAGAFHEMESELSG